MSKFTGRVAVLMGGPASEHDVSLMSGGQVLAALGEEAFEVRIGRDGRWRIGGMPQPTLGVALDHLRDQADVVFIALHGPFGEDGTVQALLESHGIPFVGSSMAASALAMDKTRAKQVMVAVGLPTASFTVVRPGAEFSHAAAEEAGARLGWPLVVKPACNGSSFGLAFPAGAAALVEAVTGLLDRSEEVLLERYVQGRELTCGVLEVGEERVALPVTEMIVGAGHTYFDYVAKYTPGITNEVTPADIPDALRDEVQRHALVAHEILGCRDMSRTDFMLDAEGRPFVLETNTIPGFTATSLLPQAAAVHGLDFAALVHHLVDRARRRGKSRRW